MREIEGRKLKPANENPWYVLMTLYGGDHKRNRCAWNAWAGKALEEKEQRLAAETSRIDLAELQAWDRLKEDILHLHKKAWIERNGDLQYPGLPSACDPVLLAHTSFSTKLVLEGMVFASEARFDLSTFHFAADFNTTTFCSGAYFEKATFCAALEFGRATFSGIAYFVEATFKAITGFEHAIFEKGASFNNATFEANTSFERAIFHGGTWFSEATFKDVTRYCHATFGEDANDYRSASLEFDFRAATFEKMVDFKSAEFNGSCSFASAKFRDVASFNSLNVARTARFDSAIFDASVNFKEATFTDDATFRLTVFSGPVKFVGTRLLAKAKMDERHRSGIDFSDAIFEKPTSFRLAKFANLYPDFTGTVLHSRTDFSGDDTLWPKLTELNASATRETCSIIRHVLAQQGMTEESHFFFRREMAAAGKIENCPRRWPYLAFGWLSNYGESIAKPVKGLVVAWGVPALIYLWAFAQAQSVHCPLDVIGRAIGFSFVSLFKFLGFQRLYFKSEFWLDLNWALKVLSAGQTIAGIMLLFFLGLGLRQRFRLR